MELFLNGKSLGRRGGSNGVFVWENVQLDLKKADVRAIGDSDSKTYRDTVRWTISTNAPAPPPQAMPATSQFSTTQSAPAAPPSPAPATQVPTAKPGMFFGGHDVQLLEQYGGSWAPAHKGPFNHTVPVDSIDWSNDKPRLSDDTFAAVFPAIQRMDPHRLYLVGHQISDRSIDLLNRLHSLQLLDLRRTNITADGLRQLKVPSLVYLQTDVPIDPTLRYQLKQAMPKLQL